MAKSKWGFYLKHMILMSTNNKTRLILTSVGIFVAVFLFAGGQIIASSYYDGSMRLVQEMRDKTVVVTSYEEQSVVTASFAEFTRTLPVIVMTASENKAILSAKIGENRYLNLMARIHGVTDMKNVTVVVTAEGDTIPVAPELVKGRLLSPFDNQGTQKVCVIDELTAALLFGDADPIGQNLQLGVNFQGAVTGENPDPVFLEVVGVIKNSYVAETTFQYLRSRIDITSGNITVDTSLYVPASVITDVIKDTIPSEMFLYAFDSDAAYRDFADKASTFIEITSRRGFYYGMATKESMLSELAMELSYTKTLLNIISLLLCIISGISIMSIVFFSVKERIPEIGIRKAFGASRMDIAFQFMFEMVIIAFFVSILAIVSAFIACKLAERFLTESLYMSFKISVTYDVMLLPLFVGMLEAVICSIIPSLYAAKINVTESLRFE